MPSSPSPSPFRFVVVGALVASALFTLRALAAMPLTFAAPHVIETARSTIEEPFARALDAELEEANVTSVDQMLQFALERTDANLHFGLDHPTKLVFGAREREGNCVEYAHLFATIFNTGALRHHLAAHAYVIRSDARLAGFRVPDPAFRDHEWVLVAPESVEAPLRFVDPTLADVGLDWDISSNVEGALPPLPAAAPQNLSVRRSMHREPRGVRRSRFDG